MPLGVRVTALGAVCRRRVVQVHSALKHSEATSHNAHLFLSRLMVGRPELNLGETIPKPLHFISVYTHLSLAYSRL